MPIAGIQGSRAAAASRVAAEGQVSGAVGRQSGRLGGHLGGRAVRVADGGSAYLKPVPQSRIQGLGRGRARGATVSTLPERRVRIPDSHLPKLAGPPLPSRPGSVAWTPISAEGYDRARQEASGSGHIYENTKPPADPIYESLEPQDEGDSAYEVPSLSRQTPVTPPPKPPPARLDRWGNADEIYADRGQFSTASINDPDATSDMDGGYQNLSDVDGGYQNPRDLRRAATQNPPSDQTIEEVYVNPEDIIDDPDTIGDADGGYQNLQDLQRAATARDDPPTPENVKPPTEKPS